jgi:hypothetical protein
VARSTGSVSDRPWGVTLAELDSASFTGLLRVATDDKEYTISFDLGRVVGATSPLASDAAVRIAMTLHLVSSSQVTEISRRINAARDRDEVEVLGELAQLAPEHVDKLRHRLVAQRAARTFAIERGTYSVDERIAMPPGSELDVRAVIYLGARMHLSEQRLAEALRGFGTVFVIKPDALPSLDLYGFSDEERLVLRGLMDGTSVPELEAAHRDVDPRMIHAIVYALMASGACHAQRQRASSPLVEYGDAPEVTPRTSAHAEGATYFVSRTQTNPVIARTETSPAAHPITAPGAPADAAVITDTPPPSAPRLHTAPDPRQPPPPPGAVDSPSSLPAPRPGRSPGTRAPMRPQADEGTARVPTRPATSRTQTGEPAVPRTQTGQPASSRTQTSDPAASRTQTGSPPVSRTQTGNPTTSRTQTGEPAARPARAPTSPVVGRSQTYPAVARTSTARRTQALVAARMILVEQGADHFTLLGVPFDAPLDVIQTAYLNLARQLHPDKLEELGVPDLSGNAQKLFHQIGVAFGVLTEPTKRAAYVAMLTGVSSGAPRAIETTSRTRTADDIPATPAGEAFRRGESLLRRDEPAEAVIELGRACALDPTNVDYHAMLGWAQFCAARDKATIAPETRKALDKAVRVSAKPVQARFLLGRVERMLGRDREALRHFQEVLALQENHPDAQAEIRVIEARLASSPDKKR